MFQTAAVAFSRFGSSFGFLSMKYERFRTTVLLSVLVLFFSLHGMFQLITMGCFLMALLSMLITKSSEPAAAAAGEEEPC